MYALLVALSFFALATNHNLLYPIAGAGAGLMALEVWWLRRG